MKRSTKRTVMAVTLVLIGGVIMYELWEQSSKKGWSRGTFQYNK